MCPGLVPLVQHASDPKAIAGTVRVPATGHVTSYNGALPGESGEVPVVSPRGIFLSYRRQDAAPYARLLKFQLRERFPDARVFMDLDSIEAGQDFAEVTGARCTGDPRAGR